MAKFHELIRRWRLALLLLLPVAAVLLAQGASKLGFVTDYRVYFSNDNPQLKAFDAMQRTYAKSDNLLIVLSPKSADVFSSDALKAVHWVTAEAWKTPYSLRVDSITNYQRVAADGDSITVADLVANPSALDVKARDDVRRFALAEPQLVRRLVSPRGDVAAVNVTYLLPEKTPFENAEVVAFGRDLAKRLTEKHPEVEVRLTGMAMYNNAFFEAAMADGRLIPIMYGILLLITLLMFRSVLATLCVLVTVYMATGAASGIAGYLGMSLTSLSASAPLIILTVCVADAVHVAAGVLRLMRNGIGRQEAIDTTMAETTRPIIVTNIMSAAGFLALNTSEMPPFRDLGNIVAIGIGCAMTLTLTLLPILLSYAPLKPRNTGDAVTRGLGSFARWITANSQRVAVVVIPLSLLLSALTLKNEFNDQYMKWFSVNNSFRQANDYTMSHLTGLYSIEYSLAGKEGRRISDIDYLSDLGKYTDWLRTQEEVVHVSSIADTFKRINQSLKGGGAEHYRLPDAAGGLSAQSLLLYEMSLPYGLDLNNQINVDKTATRMTVTLRDVTTREMLDFEQRSMQWLGSNAPTVAAEAASTTLIFAHIGERNIRGIIKGMLGAAIVISLCLIVALGSVRLGLLSLIPNVLPILMAFGVWGLFVGQLGFSVAIVAAISLGIVVDDTVHFMSAVLHARKAKGLGIDAAIVDAFETAGSAMVATTAVIAAGFLVLATSDFALNMHMGLMTAIALVFALATDMLLMPALIKMVFKAAPFESRVGRSGRVKGGQSPAQRASEASESSHALKGSQLPQP